MGTIRTLAMREYVNVGPMLLAQVQRLSAMMELAKVRIAGKTPVSMKIILFINIIISITALFNIYSER